MDRPAYLEYGAAGPVEQHLARLRRREQKLLSSTSSSSEVEELGWQIALLDALPSRGAVMSVAELGEISSASRITGRLDRLVPALLKLPVVVARAPDGTKTSQVRERTLIGLQTHAAVSTIASKRSTWAQHAEMRARAPDLRKKLAAADKLSTVGDHGGAKATQTAALADFVGSAMAPAVLAKTTGAIEGARERAKAAAAERRMLHALVLGNELARRQTDADDAEVRDSHSGLRQSVERQVKAILAKAVVSPRSVPPGITRELEEQTREWLRKNSRTSEFRSAEDAHGNDVAVQYLNAPPDRLFRMYDVELQGAGMKRTTFLNLVRDSGEFTKCKWYSCLCGTFDEGRKDLEALVTFLRSDEVREFMSWGADSEEWREHREGVRQLRDYLVRDYLNEVKRHVRELQPEQLVESPLEDLPRVDYDSVLGSLRHRISELGEADDAADAFSEKLTKLLEPVEAYERHVMRWAHQEVRFDVSLSQLTAKKRILVLDFKEKIRKGRSTHERQMDYFGGEYMSLLGIVMYHVDGSGATVQTNYLFASNDTKQDTEWVCQALDVAMPKVLEGAPEGVVLELWKDSGPHFHNGILLAKLKQILLDKTPLVSAIRDEYGEPGHCKGPADQVFATVGKAIDSYISLGQNVDDAADLAKCLDGMARAFAKAIDIDRGAQLFPYKAFKGINSFLSFVLAGGSDPQWVARPLSYCGESVVMRGKVVLRERQLGRQEASRLLSAGLKRRANDYNGCVDCLGDLLDGRKGGIITKNDAFTNSVPGGPWSLNAEGARLVQKLKFHFETCYSETIRERALGSGSPRSPTGWANLIVKAEALVEARGTALDAARDAVAGVAPKKSASRRRPGRARDDDDDDESPELESDSDDAPAAQEEEDLEPVEFDEAHIDDLNEQLKGVEFVDDGERWRVLKVSFDAEHEEPVCFYFDAKLGDKGTVEDCEYSGVQEVVGWIKRHQQREARAAESSDRDDAPPHKRARTASDDGEDASAGAVRDDGVGDDADRAV